MSKGGACIGRVLAESRAFTDAVSSAGAGAAVVGGAVSVDGEEQAANARISVAASVDRIMAGSRRQKNPHLRPDPGIPPSAGGHGMEDWSARWAGGLADR